MQTCTLEQFFRLSVDFANPQKGLKMQNQIDQENTPVIETTERARQGKTGQGVRYVLIFSTLGVLLAFALVFIFEGH
jgi:hypothetical protein